MSGSLMWEPAERKKKSLPTALKWALTKRYGGDPNVTVDQNNVDYLRGLLDAGTEGAQELIDAIEKHGSVQLRVEY